MAKVIRVFGKADSFDVEFTPKGKVWEVDVPPDMTDGVYAVQLTAIDELGESAYWVGELYMSNGVCHFRFTELPYRGRVSFNEYETKFRKYKYDVLCQVSHYSVEFTDKYSFQFKKKKRSSSNYEVEFVTNLKANESVEHCYIHIKTNEAKVNKTTGLHTKCKPSTEIHIRKGCCCA